MIREEVYNKLLRMKRPGESFSELFDRLAEREGTEEVLRSMRGSLDFARGVKEEMKHDIFSRRRERRNRSSLAQTS